MLPRLVPRIGGGSSSRSYTQSTSDISPRYSGTMPSLRTFRIEFDRPGATYAPGEIVTGNVIIDLAREKTIRALKLTVKGEANVHWERKNATTNNQRHSETNNDEFQGKEQYFNLTYLLLGDTGDEEVRLPSGYSQYPFSFVLPHNIPCSFEHTNGHIRYTTKAVIDRPWRFDHECKIAFTVVTSYDLNAHSRQCMGIDDEINQSFCCFCFFNLGTMKMNINLSTTGFVPGQSIETKVNLENMSNVNVTRICVKLERSLAFHAKTPYRATKTDKAIVRTDQRTRSFGQLSRIISRLQVPPIPPSQLEHCGIIDQKYSVRFTVHVSGMHFSITKAYPILIGTIPLRSIIPSAPYQQNIPWATVPTLDDDPPPPMPRSPDDAPPNVPYLGPQRIDFASLDQPGTSTDHASTSWDMPPPSYEECMQRADSIKDHDESNYVHGVNEPFAPRYPVFNFPSFNADKILKKKSKNARRHIKKGIQEEEQNKDDYAKMKRIRIVTQQRRKGIRPDNFRKTIWIWSSTFGSQSECEKRKWKSEVEREEKGYMTNHELSANGHSYERFSIVYNNCTPNLQHSKCTRYNYSHSATKCPARTYHCRN